MLNYVMTSENFIEIETELFKSMVIDDHDNKECRLEGIVTLASGHICPYFEDSAFSLNPLYIDEDGRYHISTTSIGGCVERRKNKSERLGFQMYRYNETVARHRQITSISVNHILGNEKGRV